MINISKEAIQHALRFQDENPKWRDLSLRIYLEGKGCDGFTYGVCFDQLEQEDHVFPCETGKERKLDIIVDQKTYDFVKDSEITWLTKDNESGFLVNNPRHKNFRGKFYLRSFWKKKLSASNTD